MPTYKFIFIASPYWGEKISLLEETEPQPSPTPLCSGLGALEEGLSVSP